MSVCVLMFIFLKKENKMGICKNCGNTFHIKRKKLGYDLCLQCGEKQARKHVSLLFETVNRHKERVSMMVCR